MPSVRVALRGRDAAAAFEHDQQILDRAVAQAIVEDDPIADQRSPSGERTTTLPMATTLPVSRFQSTRSEAR